MPPSNVPNLAASLPEALLMAGLDRSPDAVLGAEKDGRVIYANLAACELLGHARAEFQALSLPALGLDGSREDWKAPVHETTLLTRTSNRVPVEIRQSRVLHGAQDITFLYIRDITARKAAEAALHKSESRFALAFNTSPDAINITRLEDGSYLEVSRGFERLTGWKREEVLGRTSLDLGIWANPKDRDAVVALLKNKGEYDSLPISFRTKDGSIIKGLMSGRLVSLDGVPCLLTVTRDVTAQVEAQEALGNLSELISAITANVPAFIFLLDPACRILFVNRLPSGIARGDVIGQDFNGWMMEKAKPQVLEAMARILQGSDREILEGWGFGPGQEPRWYRCILGPMRESGQVVGAVLIAMDESERRSQEDRLRESEDRFQAFQKHTPDALFWIEVTPGGKMRLEGMNPAAEAWMGTTSAQAQGRPFEDFSPPQVATMFHAHAMECMEAGRPKVFEEALPSSSGVRHVSTTLVPVSDASGRIYRIVGSSRDTTQNRQMETALRQSQKLESLGVMAGGIAHDFNNLLTAIMGNLNLAQLKLPESSPAFPHLEAVETTVLKASELTRQMLAYSGKGRFSVKPLDLNAVVSGMAHLLDVTIHRNARLVFNPGSDLPGIEGDTAQIQQVVMNLVTNAGEALADRMGTVRVSTGREDLDADRIQAEFPAQPLAPGPFVVLTVEDDGCGMAPEVLSRIFDPFFTTKVKGRGLGLSALLGILKGHKAGIRILSAPGSGSSFQIYFPASPKAVALKPRILEPPTGAFSGTVLLVDDEIVILESITMALESFGFQVVQAKDGVEAVERFEALAPNLRLVIMDLTMPRMDGATAFGIMQRSRPEIPVVLSSGYDRQALDGVHPAAFVQKPYRLKELSKLLQEVLAR
jgi:PAS domain S-box-containing protein